MNKGKERQQHRVWVAQPGSGLDKRQATLQMRIGPEGMSKLALIFRGTGKRISKDEIAAYDDDVDVFGSLMHGLIPSFLCSGLRTPLLLR